MLFQTCSKPPKTLQDRQQKGYESYKGAILFFAFIDQYYSEIFSSIPFKSKESSESSSSVAEASGVTTIDITTDANDWAAQLGDWIRHNDDTLLRLTSRALKTFQDDLLPATSVDEIIDVCGLLNDIPSPESFLIEMLSMIP